MAGLAEAAYAMMGLITSAGFLAVIILTAIAWRIRSITVAALACILLAGIGWELQPWKLIQVAASDDPDQVSWLGTFRALGVVWAFLCIGGIATVPIVAFGRRRIPKCGSLS